MNQLTPAEAASKAISVLGGPVAAARLLNVKDHRYQTVQSWLSNRVPAEYCPAIERETRLLGTVVRCEELRPDVDWAVLRTNDEDTAAHSDAPQSAG
jgi:DNA-binding transcriptional regulator YdaS (Cro superfamily)